MENAEFPDDYVLQRYSSAIEYYWRASRHNKRSYKRTRGLVVVLGALVTLVASLSSASFIESRPLWDTAFALATPLLAVILTITVGLSQSFHWGAAWRDMALNAEQLEQERDRLLVTKPEERDPPRELAVLNTLLLAETQTFFQRILGGSTRKDSGDDRR